ncbi:MAG: dihydropteroate synthase [Prevotella sp.]|nr:dihydropteroate synthase [Prevotella sp.]
MNYTLNCNGRLLSLAEPQVMGILNVTPDSFYGNSRQQTDTAIAHRVEEILTQGGSMVDVGACSTRPDSKPVSEAEEMERLHQALPIVRRVAPEAVVSVDTFRPSVARMVVEDYGVDIINDVGESSATRSTADMFRMVARLRVPYIYTSRKATMREVLLDCAEAVDQLRSLGQKDILLDPGFGFGKTLEQNYEVLNGLERMQMIGLPVLVGVSRKSMIYRLLDTEPEQALNGSTVLHTIALQKGASILRVHDVREAVECCRLVRQTMNSK